MTLAFCNVTMLRLAAPTICVAPSGKPTMLATLILDYAMTSKFPWFTLNNNDDNVIHPNFAKYTHKEHYAFSSPGSIYIRFGCLHKSPFSLRDPFRSLSLRLCVHTPQPSSFSCLPFLLSAKTIANPRPVH